MKNVRHLLILLIGLTGFFASMQIPLAGQNEILDLTNQNGISTSINTIGSIQFGTFYPGFSGGTIQVNFSGSRTATGSVILLHSGDYISPSVFEIHAAGNCMMQVLLETQVHLHGSTGGIITLFPGSLNLGSAFVTPADAENGFLISMGGTLEVGGLNQNPPGNYSGVFSITIVAE